MSRPMRHCRTALSGTWRRRPGRKGRGGERMTQGNNLTPQEFKTLVHAGVWMTDIIMYVVGILLVVGVAAVCYFL